MGRQSRWIDDDLPRSQPQTTASEDIPGTRKSRHSESSLATGLCGRTRRAWRLGPWSSGRSCGSLTNRSHSSMAMSLGGKDAHPRRMTHRKSEAAVGRVSDHVFDRCFFCCPLLFLLPAAFLVAQSRKTILASCAPFKSARTLLRNTLPAQVGTHARATVPPKSNSAFSAIALRDSR